MPSVEPAQSCSGSHETNSQDADTQGQYLLTSLIDCAGVMRGKIVPKSRAKSVAKSGVGASPSWALFCADNDIAWIPSITAVGDHRLRADLSAAVEIDDKLSWAPAEVYEQEGDHGFWCSRHLLRQQCEKLAAKGIEMKVAGEMEFFLLPNDDKPIDGWQAYGVSSLLNKEEFVSEVVQTFARLGLGLEQFHGEYGNQQYELSLSPADPIRAMDKIALARLLLGRIARRYDCKVSFSAQPALNSVGNGAHIHFSFTRDGKPLLSAADGPHGISTDGGAIIAGIVDYLPELVALLAPSVLSCERLKPGHWAGAFACWGMENREAAVRYCSANPSNPYGANIEVKCIDPSANPYVACAAVLMMANAGLEESLPLPKETTVDPALLDETERAKGHVVQLVDSQSAILERLEQSALAQSEFPPQMLEALVAVRRLEMKNYANKPIEETIQALRFAWSV